MSRVYTTFLDPKNPHDFQIMLANEKVREWMKDPECRTYLNELKSEAILTKGNSVAGNIKHKHIIPQDAYLLLPSEVRENRKKLNHWVKTYHPYLLITP